jgi:molybdopterin converting factor small subunit
MKLRLFISGRNYNLAEGIPDHLTLAEGATLDDALEALAGLLPGGTRLPASCLVAVSGRHCGTVASHSPEKLRDGDELVVLTPVAGG